MFVHTVLYVNPHQLLDTMYISIHMRIQQDNDMCNQHPTIRKYTSWKQCFGTYKIRWELKVQFNIKLTINRKIENNDKVLIRTPNNFSTFSIHSPRTKQSVTIVDTIWHKQKSSTRDNTIHHKKTLH